MYYLDRKLQIKWLIAWETFSHLGRLCLHGWPRCWLVCDFISLHLRAPWEEQQWSVLVRSWQNSSRGQNFPPHPSSVLPSSSDANLDYGNSGKLTLLFKPHMLSPKTVQRNCVSFTFRNSLSHITTHYSIKRCIILYMWMALRALKNIMSFLAP